MRECLDQVGAYLTDGVFLYRLDALLVTAAGEMVDLEDCYRLDVVRIPLNVLRARRLRVVTPTLSTSRGGKLDQGIDQGLHGRDRKLDARP
jgi:hypothetical protein